MRGTLKTRDKGNTGTGVPRAKATPTALQENEGSRVESESTHTGQQQTNVSLWCQEKSLHCGPQRNKTKEKLPPLPGSKHLKQLEQEVTF